jgi:two-component system CheB/CheR fusion protein
VELRGPIAEVRRTQGLVEIAGVPWRSPQDTASQFDVCVTPLLRDGQLTGIKITFHDVTRIRELTAEVARSRSALEAAYEELQSTNEELETTNEELQSTVEELETMNEELQSTNVEMEAINAELRDRTGAMARDRRYLDSVLDSIDLGVVVIDSASRVQTWNARAGQLWGLGLQEVQGRSVQDLDVGLPFGDLRDLIQHCIDGGSVERRGGIEGHDRRGKAYVHDVTCAPLREKGGEVSGVVLLVDGRPLERGLSPE